MTHHLPVVEEPTSSLRSDGSRNYVHPADVHGRFTSIKNFVFGILIAIYVVIPFIRVGEHPAVFLDIVNRKFYLFGRTFNAQDFWLVFFLLSGVGLALFIVTATKGRLWCGYACPHTVFLEGVYRRVERWIEGPRAKRLRRNASATTFDKVWRKTLKHVVFVAISVLLSHVFLSYFVSLPSLVEMVRRNPGEHPTAFAWMGIMSALLYFNFSWFREQLCLIVCPYGRLQSAMTDKDTMVIGYDVGRGEPRGKAKDPATGDCVDCKRCVVVCPTGIDIRNGLQMECVGCAACVDACDDIMGRLGREVGLVRYDSLNGLEGRPRRMSRPRLYFYGLVVLLWTLGAAFAFSGSEDFEANILRSAGAPFTVVEGKVRNSFRIHLVNKANRTEVFTIRTSDYSGVELILPIERVTLDSLGSTYVPVLAVVSEELLEPGLRVRLVVSAHGEGGVASVREIEAPFVAPSR